MDALRIDAYVRVSRVGGREGPGFISPDVQRDSIHRWAAAHGATILAEHVDLDQSGGKADRPGLQAVLHRIEAGEAGGVVVAKLDRFGRSLLDALDAIRRIDQAGGKFVSVAEQFDTSTPVGKLVLRIMLSLAEFELDRIREQWGVAQARAVARGVHIASRTPTGYSRREDGGLEPHPEHGPVITELFRRRAAGASWRELCDLLDRHAVVGPYGAAQWTTRAVSHLVTNRAYLGEARSGRHTNPHAHTALTDRITWQAAQGRRGPALPKDRDGALLSGVLRCAGCRYLLKPDSMRDRNGAQLTMYRCRGRHAAGTCQGRVAVLRRVVEPAVEATFFRTVGRLQAEAQHGTPDLALAEAELERAEADLAAYRDDERIVGALGADRYVGGLQARVRAAEHAQGALDELRAESEIAGLPDIADLEEMWPELTVPERRKLISAVFDCVFIRSGRLPITARLAFFERGDAPADLPRRGKRVPFGPLAWPDDPPRGPGVAVPEDLKPGTLER